MTKNVKAVLWTLAIVLCFSVAVYFAGCGSDSAADAGGGGGGGGGGSAELDAVYADWKCDTSPTDTCASGICAIIQGGKAMAQAPGFQDAVACYTDLATCYEAACTDPANPDATALSTCSTDFYTCICAVESLKQYMQAACDQIP